MPISVSCQPKHRAHNVDPTSTSLSPLSAWFDNHYLFRCCIRRICHLVSKLRALSKPVIIHFLTSYDNCKGHILTNHRGAYGSSKAALNHLARTLAVEEPDVTTVAVRPGVVDTDMQVRFFAIQSDPSKRYWELQSYSRVS
jgi:NAD(P)-dependent dehydrogenase (short-subunit alcohol dehydrogenase family)